MRIAELNDNQTHRHNTKITITGAVRATYTNPFPHFLLEDNSGTLICLPNGNLPGLGGHLEITGLFVLETPEKCTVEIALLKETTRGWVVHQSNSCDLHGCEFAAQVAA
jgi:hypothetical protein